MRQSWETMTFISAGHIILTPTQPVGSGRPQRGSNPGPPDQESCALPTELPCPTQTDAVRNMSVKFFVRAVSEKAMLVNFVSQLEPKSK